MIYNILQAPVILLLECIIQLDHADLYLLHVPGPSLAGPDSSTLPVLLPVSPLYHTEQDRDRIEEEEGTEPVQTFPD